MQRKNCDPLVLGPAFAILKQPTPKCFPALPSVRTWGRGVWGGLCSIGAGGLGCQMSGRWPGSGPTMGGLDRLATQALPKAHASVTQVSQKPHTSLTPHKPHTSPSQAPRKPQPSLTQASHKRHSRSGRCNTPPLITATPVRAPPPSHRIPCTATHPPPYACAAQNAAKWQCAGICHQYITQIQCTSVAMKSPPSCPPPSPWGTVSWPMNSKKSIANHRRRRLFFVGCTRIQVTVVWCSSPPGGGGEPSSLGGGGGGHKNSHSEPPPPHLKSAPPPKRACGGATACHPQRCAWDLVGAR